MCILSNLSDKCGNILFCYWNYFSAWAVDMPSFGTWFKLLILLTQDQDIRNIINKRHINVPKYTVYTIMRSYTTVQRLQISNATHLVFTERTFHGREIPCSYSVTVHCSHFESMTSYSNSPILTNHRTCCKHDLGVFVLM